MATADTTQTPENTPANPNAGKRKIMLLVLCRGRRCSAARASGPITNSYGRWSESTDDAYVNGNVVEITPLVTGTVVQHRRR